MTQAHFIHRTTVQIIASPREFVKRTFRRLISIKGGMEMDSKPFDYFVLATFHIQVVQTVFSKRIQ